MRVPRAATLQGGSNPLDDALTHAARIGNPKRRWWWGLRSKVVPASELPDPGWLPSNPAEGDQVSTYGAWCYLCERYISTWSSRHPMPDRATMAIGEHRMAHLQGRLDTTPTESPQ